MAFPFRITRGARPPGLQNVPPGTPQPPPPNPLASYMDRLIKLIPAEVLGLYLTVRNIFSGDDLSQTPAPPGVATAEGERMAQAGGFLGWWPVICVVLLVAFRIWGTRDDSGKVHSAQPTAIAISTISFVIWIYAMGHTILGWPLPDPRYAGVAVAVWVFVLPMLYRGE